MKNLSTRKTIKRIVPPIILLSTSSWLKVLLPIKSPLTVKKDNDSHPCGEDDNHKAQPLSMWRYIDNNPYKARPL